MGLLKTFFGQDPELISAIENRILEMHLFLAQENPENASFYYQKVSRIYSSLGNEEEALRFQMFAQQAQGGKG